MGDGEEAARENLHTRAKDDDVVGAASAFDHHVQAATTISTMLHKDLGDVRLQSAFPYACHFPCALQQCP